MPSAGYCWAPITSTRAQPTRSCGLIHLQGNAQRTAGLLSHGQKQWLEIGILPMQEPKVLLLDEPVAGMSDEETERTAELFLSLEGKHSLVVVEHDMKFVDQLTQPSSWAAMAWARPRC